MTLLLDWRYPMEGEGNFVLYDSVTQVVLCTWPIEIERLTDFLNDLQLFDASARSDGVENVTREDFGDLIMTRSIEGDVIRVEPQNYWENIAYWYRSRGEDPHSFDRRQSSQG